MEKANRASSPPTTSVTAMFRNINSELVRFSNLEIIAITRVLAEIVTSLCQSIISE